MNTRTYTATAAALFCLWQLVACTKELDIKVFQSGDSPPRFVLSPDVSDVKVDAISVVRIGETAEANETVWRIYSEPPGVIIREIQYRELPFNFKIDVPGSPLIPGQEYLVIGTAAGRIGQTRFVAMSE